MFNFLREETKIAYVTNCLDWPKYENCQQSEIAMTTYLFTNFTMEPPFVLYIM